MEKLVIMPGGFHPFHTGHMSLYNAALAAFPGAEVYVAATNDTSERPFAFAVKEKLAQLAGIPKGYFVQVNSPFRANEITQKITDPGNTALIFVRSQKDRGTKPLPGGTKKDGTPSYLQPMTKDALEPITKHAYMVYLPTVEFGAGLSSATQIRQLWPTLSADEKTKLVNQLYPVTKGNKKATNLTSKMLDRGMGIAADSVTETQVVNDPEQGLLIRPDGGMGTWTEARLTSSLAAQFSNILQMLKSKNYTDVAYVLYKSGAMQAKVKALADLQQFQDRQGGRALAKGREIQLETPVDYAIENPDKI